MKMVKRHLKLRASLADRFYDKVAPDPNSGCWLWTGAVKELGYGVIGLGRRSQGIRKAHRVSWELHRGPIPEGLCVCHKCDVPGCVNPNHLFLGTLADNAQDTARKGRLKIPDNRGERATWSKLKTEQAADIATRRLTAREFAALYGVSESAVCRIWEGKNWTATLKAL